MLRLIKCCQPTANSNSFRPEFSTPPPPLLSAPGKTTAATAVESTLLSLRQLELHLLSLSACPSCLSLSLSLTLYWALSTFLAALYITPAAKTNYIKMSCKIFVCWQRSVIVVSPESRSVCVYAWVFGPFNADFAKSFSSEFFTRQKLLEIAVRIMLKLWKIYVF